MDRNEISFENRPKAVAHLRSEVAEIKTLVEKGQTPAVTPKRIPIGIEEACQLIGKAKPTITRLSASVYFPVIKTARNSISLKMNYWNGLPKAKRKPCRKLNRK